MKISEKIRFYRQQKALTQTELADKIGVKKGHVSNWENGSNNPGKENLANLAAALGVSIDELFSESDPKGTPVPETLNKVEEEAPTYGALVDVLEKHIAVLERHIGVLEEQNKELRARLRAFEHGPKQPGLGQ